MSAFSLVNCGFYLTLSRPHIYLPPKSREGRFVGKMNPRKYDAYSAYPTRPSESERPSPYRPGSILPKEAQAPPLPSVSVPSKEAQGPERYTISEDRSAGSNLEVHNLAALKDRTSSQQMREQARRLESVPMPAFNFNLSDFSPFTSEISMGHAQLQQRFGQLRFDEGYPDDHMDKGDQTLLKDDLFTVDNSTNHDYLRHQLKAKYNWVGDIEGLDIGSGLQANIEKLQQTLASMQKELGELERQKQMHANRQFQILYRIEGDCYFDPPEWTQGNKSVVSRIPVKNLGLFLERNKNVVFIVYRDFYQVPLKTGAKNKISPPHHVRESIHPVSRQLRKTLQVMLKHDWRYGSVFQQLHRKGEIDAPYLFIYHYRTYWKEMLAQCPDTVRDDLELLAVYVSENYGKDYMAADALFSQRRVSAEFLKYLFQPGDILVSRSEGEYRGLIARSWPQENAAIPAPKILARGNPTRESRRTRAPEHGYTHHRSYIDESRGSDSNSEDHSDVDSDVDCDSDSANGTSEDETWPTVDAVEHKNQDVLQQFLRRIFPGNISKQEKDGETAAAKSLDKEINIKIWQWNFDGDFKRVEGNIMLRLSQSSVNDTDRAKEWNMHDLDVYPLRFAPQPLVQTLRRRGMMFWKCRKRCLVSYHESNDKTQDEVGVSLFPSMPFDKIEANFR
jgi:hypothetical protein